MKYFLPEEVLAEDESLLPAIAISFNGTQLIPELRRGLSGVRRGTIIERKLRQLTESKQRVSFHLTTLLRSPRIDRA